MEGMATLLGADEDWTVAPPEYQQRTRDGSPMRWKLSERWIEFECGCSAERFRELKDVRRYDPIIFQGLPEQAVYVKVCDFHQFGVWHARLRYGRFATFDQWYRARYRRLTGKAGA